MAYDIGIKLKLDGEKDYRDAINKITQVNKTLDAELKAVTSSFDKNTTAEEKKAKTEEILQRQLDNSKDKLNEVAKGLKQATENFAEDSKEVLSWRQAYAKAETDVNNVTNKIKSLDDALEDTKDESSSFKEIFTANLSADMVMNAITGIVNGIKKIGESLVNTAKESRLWADDLRTMARQMSISTDKLQEFKYMQELVDVSAESLASGFKKITNSMKSAMKGSGDAYDNFKALGVAIYDENGELRESEDVFFDVIDALGQMENATEKDMVAMTLLGKSATDFNTIMDIGSEGIRELRQEAHDTGYVLSGEAIDSLVGVSDQFVRMDNAMTTAKNTIGVALAPVIISLCDGIIALINQTGVIIENFKEFGRQCNNLITIIRDAFSSLPSVIEEILETIKRKFQEIISSAVTWGKDMIQGFINGIKSKIADIRSAIGNVTSEIRARLHFSRPDTGELRDYETWMPDFIDGLAKGINKNAYKVTDAVANMTNGMAVNLGSTGRGGATVILENVTFNGYTDAQGSALVQRLNKELGRLYG